MPPNQEALPLPPEMVPRPTPLSDSLGLGQVVSSVYQYYPLLEEAALQQQVANGQRISALGEFDLKAEAFSRNNALGFYRTWRHGASLSQPLYDLGGNVKAAYKFGDGNFEPWFGERETNEGGEFSLAVDLPFVQNRFIDPRRSALWQARLAQRAVEPEVQAQLLQFVLAASEAYWNWVASGLVVEAQQELLDLAIQRNRQIELRVQAGDQEQIILIDNERLIADREAKLISADRKLQLSAIKLSLFLRDANGQPQIPPASALPESFPQAERVGQEQLAQGTNQAVQNRPELAALDFKSQQLGIVLREARNNLFPVVNGALEVSKDVGAPTSVKGDKTPFILFASLYGEMPIQRRKARGKIQETQGKLAQLRAKRQFTVDKVRAEVQDAVSALQAAYERIQRAERNLQLAERALEFGRQFFEAGDIDLIVLNIREEAVTNAKFTLIAAQFDYFVAQAAYQAAVGAGADVMRRPLKPNLPAPH